MLAECFGALLHAVGASSAYHGSDEDCRLRLEGDMDLSFMRHGAALAVNMPLAVPPPSSDGRREFFRRLLRAMPGLLPENGTGIFLVPSLAADGRLILGARLPAEPRAFVHAVELFLNGAEKLRLVMLREKPSPSEPRILLPGEG